MLHDLVDLFFVCDIDFGYVLNVDAHAFLFSNFQVLSRGIDQIMHLLHIDFNHGDLDLELNLLRGVGNFFKDVTDHSWNHTSLRFIIDVRSKHRMRLTARCLSVGEDGPVEAFHDADDNRLYSLLIDVALFCVGIEYLIVAELAGSSNGIRRGY